ncbi:uncharacterized protein LOC122458292 [Dermochelys coriacea]|uniref:uncharacterized protein LOC122458292 n=1 Tax=Dermochelys coriacea TaxID=27794 RepID=UPI001CA7C8FA|nr:uncharacterized protein LOC122458292 [Dermochelys coriacea]
MSKKGGWQKLKEAKERRQRQDVVLKDTPFILTFFPPTKSSGEEVQANTSPSEPAAPAPDEKEQPPVISLAAVSSRSSEDFPSDSNTKISFSNHPGKKKIASKPEKLRIGRSSVLPVIIKSKRKTQLTQAKEKEARAVVHNMKQDCEKTSVNLGQINPCAYGRTPRGDVYHSICKGKTDQNLSSETDCIQVSLSLLDQTPAVQKQNQIKSHVNEDNYPIYKIKKGILLQTNQKYLLEKVRENGRSVGQFYSQLHWFKSRITHLALVKLLWI